MKFNYISRIRKILRKKGWSQNEMAQIIGVTHAALNRWINGNADPRKSHRAKIDQLFRQHVGPPSIPRMRMMKIIRETEKLKIRNLREHFRNNEDLRNEFVIDSTYQSNTIEGTTLTPKETEVLIMTRTPAKDKPFLDNVVSLNHARIVKDILNGEIKPPFGQEMILHLHGQLFHGIRDDAGHYSTRHRVVLGLDIQLTHPQDIPEEMASLVKNLNHPACASSFPEWLTRSHADFELIHPFGDGNGRIGRLLMMLQCLTHDFPPIVIENEKKASYLDTLEEAQRRSTGQLVAFLCEEIKRSHHICRRYLA